MANYIPYTLLRDRILERYDLEEFMDVLGIDFEDLIALLEEQIYENLDELELGV